MRFLADENLPRDVVDVLRREGHDVTWIRADSPERDDPQVLDRATAEERILITADSDFGEIIFRFRRAASSGVILLRLSGSPQEQADVLSAVLVTRGDWNDHFAVVTDDRVRMRPLPPATP